MTSRYQSFSLYLWVALFHLAAIGLPQWSTYTLPKPWRKGVLIGGLTLFLVLHYASFAMGARNLANFSRDRHQGKTCLTFIGSFQDERCFTESIYTKLNQRVLKTIGDINRLGFIQPPLALPMPIKSDLKIMAKSQPIAGRLQTLTMQKNDDKWEYYAAGILTLGNGCQPTRSILLAYEKDGSTIPFTAAKVGKSYRGMGQILGDFVCPDSRWSKSFELDKLVKDPQKRLDIMRSPRITAWAFDTDRGTVYPLEGSYSFPQKP
jgi:hypothetical protein